MCKHGRMSWDQAGRQWNFSKEVLSGHWGLKREQPDESRPFFVTENHERQMRDEWKETESFMTPWQLRLFVETWETGDGISFPNKGFLGQQVTALPVHTIYIILFTLLFCPPPFAAVSRFGLITWGNNTEGERKGMRVSEESEGEVIAKLFFNQPTAGKQQNRKLWRNRNVKFGHMRRDKRIAKDWRRLGVLLTCRVGVFASLSAPSVWLYLCLPPPWPRRLPLLLYLLRLLLCLPPPPTAHTLHCTLSPHRLADDQGSSTQRNWWHCSHAQHTYVHSCQAAYKAYTHADPEHLLASRAENINTLIHIRWLKGWLGLKDPPSPVLHIVPLSP